jgi:hypothetical protein
VRSITIEINIEYDLSHISETLEENKTEEGNLVRQGFLIGFFVPISDRALLSGIIIGENFNYHFSWHKYKSQFLVRAENCLYLETKTYSIQYLPIIDNSFSHKRKCMKFLIVNNFDNFVI